MRIGIAAPIEINALRYYLEDLSDYDLSLGLGGTAVNILIERFIQQGHQVTVFTLDPKIQSPKTLYGKNLKILIGRFRTSAYKKMLDFCRSEYKTIRQFINKESNSLDVINAHWSYEYAIGALLACPEKTIVTFRDDAPSILRLLKHPYRLSRLLMDKWVRNKAKYVSYNSQYLRDLIGINGSIIGNPISNKSVGSTKRHPGEQTAFKIFFVSNGTDPRKNPHLAVEAYIYLKQTYQDLEMHFIGKGYEENGQFAGRYKNKGGLFFHGFQPHRVLMEMMTRYQIMVHTSLEESFGNNLIEAMAKGIPVVAGETSGAVPWVLDYGKAGLLVDVTNVKLIAKGIQELIEDEVLYNHLSEAGFKYVTENFSEKSVSSKYIDEYKRVINESATCIK